MTAESLAKSLGISRALLFKYRKLYPGSPASFEDVEEWRLFVEKHKNYASDRTKPRHLKEKPVSKPAEGDEATAPGVGFDAEDERRERIIKLRLHNEIERENLRLLRRETLTVKETQDTLAGIAATLKAELLELPGQIAESLAGRDVASIQSSLDTAIRKTLDRLAWPEGYFEPKTQTFRTK